MSCMWWLIMVQLEARYPDVLGNVGNTPFFLTSGGDSGCELPCIWWDIVRESFEWWVLLTLFGTILQSFRSHLHSFPRQISEGLEPTPLIHLEVAMRFRAWYGPSCDTWISFQIQWTEKSTCWRKPTHCSAPRIHGCVDTQPSHNGGEASFHGSTKPFASQARILLTGSCASTSSGGKGLRDHSRNLVRQLPAIWLAMWYHCLWKKSNQSLIGSSHSEMMEWKIGEQLAFQLSFAKTES